MRRLSRTRAGDGDAGRDDGLSIGDEANATFGVAGWTLVSRGTGLLRVAVAGAVLGPTFFANIFQATNLIPNITYNLLAGSLLTALIVPVLVEALDHQGLDHAKQLLRQIVGVVTAGFTAAALIVLAISPLIVHLLTIGIHRPDALARGRLECWVLLFLVIPQIGLYGIVAVSIAAQNARGRFALAAAAPAIENVGLIVTLVLLRGLFGASTEHVSNHYLVFLGAGATLSVLLHAAVQCFGAARAGLPVWPSWHWTDPAVKALYRRIMPAIGTASLDASWVFIMIVAAGTVPGGVVAIQIGFQFYYLPVALSAKSVGTVLLPRLSREALGSTLDGFRETYDRGISWSWFVAVPASFVLLLFAKPIAQSIAFGEMRGHGGIKLLSTSIAAFSFALIGAATFEFAKQACYARKKVRAPFVACAVTIVIVLVGAILAATMLHGAAVLGALGITVAIAEWTRAAIADTAARKGSKHQGLPRLKSLTRHLATAAITIAPAALVARVVQQVIGGHKGAIAGVGIGVGLGMAGYVFAQAQLGAPELPPKLRRMFGRGNVELEPELERVGPSTGTALAPVGTSNGQLQTRSAAGPPPAPRVDRVTHERRLIFVIAVAASLAVVATSVVGKAIVLLPLAIGFAALMVLVARRPIWACYIFIATLPFIGGIDRGVLIPVFRPSEAVQIALTSAVLFGVILRAIRGELFAIRFTRLDRSLFVMGALASIWPIFWMLARGEIPSSSDMLGTLIIWRLASLYVLFRTVVRTQEQVRRCLWIVVVSACLLSVLAIADSLGIFRLGGIWTPNMSGGVGGGRGGATLNSAIAVGDYLAYSLAIVFAWILRGRDRRTLLAGMAAVIILGSLGTGQFSAWIAAFIALLVVAKCEGKVARLPLYLVPLGLIGAVVAWPVISQRLSGFGSGKGLPSSWLGRWDNVVNFYIPMMSGFRWVLGIRPDSVLQAPETWREVIYLESGVLWLFFVGGIPLFCGFVWFVRRAFHQTNQVSRARSDDIGVAALAARAALWAIVVLTIIDIHMTLRGGGDLFFILLGLGANYIVPNERPPNARSAPVAVEEFRPEEFEAWAQRVRVP